MDYNQLNCETNRRNVGFGSCVVDWKIFSGFIFYDTPRSFTAEELNDIVATLQADAYLDDKSLRAFPVTDVFSWTDNSEDVTIQTSDIGKKVVVRDGDYDWTSQHTQGGQCLLDAIQSHNGLLNVLYFDKDGKVMGTVRNGLMSTIPVLMHALPWKMAGGSSVAQYLVRHIFNSDFVNNGSVAFVKVQLTELLGLTGLQDLRLVQHAFDEDHGDLTLSILSLCGGSNVGQKYDTEFTSVAVYSAINAETGAPIGITSASYNAETKRFTVRMNTADPDYPQDGTILFDLYPPSTLANAQIEGYESAGPLYVVNVGS